jgi:hypothetical protein
VITRKSASHGAKPAPGSAGLGNDQFPGKMIDSCATGFVRPLFRFKDGEVLQCFLQQYIADWPESVSIELIERIRAMPK